MTRYFDVLGKAFSLGVKALVNSVVDILVSAVSFALTILITSPFLALIYLFAILIKGV